MAVVVVVGGGGGGLCFSASPALNETRSSQARSGQVRSSNVSGNVSGNVVSIDTRLTF